ncbi:hypothetical protein BASA82_000557 [Batrachochytrium salamandrivorans]|nr:hypothetical protein BASA82_000557 [Batrachochytrium salamandrivorans]
MLYLRTESATQCPYRSLVLRTGCRCILRRGNSWWTPSTIVFKNKVLSPGQANNLPISTRFDEMLALEKPLYQTNVVQFDLKLHQDFDSVQSTNVCVGLNSWLHTRVNQFLVK